MIHFAISPNIGVIWRDLWTVWNQFNVEYNIHQNTIAINPHTEVRTIAQRQNFSVYQKSNYIYDENGRLISEQRTVLQSNIAFDEILDETVIKIFKDEMDNWFLNRLREIYPATGEQYRQHPNEMIALSVCMMYPETIQQYALWIRSKRASWRTFLQWFRRLQNNNINNKLIKDFYRSVRCWLFHMASLNNNRYIRYDYSEAPDSTIIIGSDDSGKFIYLDNFINAVYRDFERYIGDIRNNEGVRRNFLGIYREDLREYLSNF